LPESTTQPNGASLVSDIHRHQGDCLTGDHDEYEDNRFEERQYLATTVNICNDMTENPYIHNIHAQPWSETMQKGGKDNY
jgi:hypothetical protein